MCLIGEVRIFDLTESLLSPSVVASIGEQERLNNYEYKISIYNGLVPNKATDRRGIICEWKNIRQVSDILFRETERFLFFEMVCVSLV